MNFLTEDTIYYIFSEFLTQQTDWLNVLLTSIGLQSFDTSKSMVDIIIDKRNKTRHFKFTLCFRKTRNYIKELFYNYCHTTTDVASRSFVECFISLDSLDTGDIGYMLDCGLLESRCCKCFCFIRKAFCFGNTRMAYSLLNHKNMQFGLTLMESIKLLENGLSNHDEKDGAACLMILKKFKVIPEKWEIILDYMCLEKQHEELLSSACSLGNSSDIRHIVGNSKYLKSIEYKKRYCGPLFESNLDFTTINRPDYVLLACVNGNVEAVESLVSLGFTTHIHQNCILSCRIANKIPIIANILYVYTPYMSLRFKEADVGHGVICMEINSRFINEKIETGAALLEHFLPLMKTPSNLIFFKQYCTLFRHK
jgi:hypothetical protein